MTSTVPETTASTGRDELPQSANPSPSSPSRQPSLTVSFIDQRQRSSVSAYDGIASPGPEREDGATDGVQTETRPELGPGENSAAIDFNPGLSPSSSSNSSSSPALEQSGETTEQSWFSGFMTSFRSVSLENKGSVARDHLALERTFLAWLRTSLAFASIGIAITQLFRLNTSLVDQKKQMKWILRHWNLTHHGSDDDDDDDDDDGDHDNSDANSLSHELASIRAEMALLQQRVSQIASSLSLSASPSFSTPASLVSGDSQAQEPLYQIPDGSMSHYAGHDYSADAVFSPVTPMPANRFNPPPDPVNRLRELGKPLGATFLGISIVILFIGFHRYFEGQHWVIHGKFPASRGSVALTAIITVSLIITSMVVVLTVTPGAYAK